jgi:hypothetical protein
MCRGVGVRHAVHTSILCITVVSVGICEYRYCTHGEQLHAQILHCTSPEVHICIAGCCLLHHGFQAATALAEPAHCTFKGSCMHGLLVHIKWDCLLMLALRCQQLWAGTGWDEMCDCRPATGSLSG